MNYFVIKCNTYYNRQMILQLPVLFLNTFFFVYIKWKFSSENHNHILFVIFLVSVNTFSRLMSKLLTDSSFKRRLNTER